MKVDSNGQYEYKFEIHTNLWAYNLYACKFVTVPRDKGHMTCISRDYLWVGQSRLVPCSHGTNEHDSVNHRTFGHNSFYRTQNRTVVRVTACHSSYLELPWVVRFRAVPDSRSHLGPNMIMWVMLAQVSRKLHVIKEITHLDSDYLLSDYLLIPVWGLKRLLAVILTHSDSKHVKLQRYDTFEMFVKDLFWEICK